MKNLNIKPTNNLIRLPRRRAAKSTLSPNPVPHRKIDLVAYAAALEILG